MRVVSGLLLVLMIAHATPAFAATRDDFTDTRARIERLYRRAGISLRPRETEEPSSAGARRRFPRGLLVALSSGLLAGLFTWAWSRLRRVRMVRRPTARPRSPARDDRGAVAPQDAAGKLVALHRRLLVALAGRGLLRHDPARTNWSYVRELPAGSPERALLARLTQHAEAATLGGRSPSVALCVELAEELAGVLDAPR